MNRLLARSNFSISKELWKQIGTMKIAAASSTKCEAAGKLDILPFACESFGLDFAQGK
jgi:hypothetical protein